MSITDILMKVAAGEALNDEEKAFAKGYNPQTEMDKASAAARRKAEKEAGEAAARVAELEAALEAAKAGRDPQKDEQLAKLAKQVEKLTKANAEAEAKVKAGERMNAIRAAAKAAGVVAADGISADIFEMLLSNAVGTIDVGDEDALKGALETFKGANPAMIADLGKGGVGVRGRAAGDRGASVNPWKEGSVNLTEQMRIMSTDPNEASRLAAEAGVKL